MRSNDTRSGTSPACTPVASLVTIWLSGMVVSSILSLWVEFQRLTRVEAALVPLARTHIVIVSARAVAATAVEAMSEAASAARSVLVVMAFLPRLVRVIPAILAKGLFPDPPQRIRGGRVGKAFPTLCSAAVFGPQGEAGP